MKLTLHGATGRMGRAVARLAHDAGDCEIVGAVAHPDDPDMGRDIGVLAGVGAVGVAVGQDTSAALLGADVVVDFSTAGALPDLLAVAAKASLPIVTGTTGLDEQTQPLLEKASQRVPVLWSRNMSLGIQVLAELVEQALRRLGEDFDAEIVEIHHRRKVDAPSGTAKRLADAVRQVRPDNRDLFERSGQVGARPRNETAVFGIRGGDVVGDHTVLLLGTGERLELTHRATSRDLFARGALQAARFLVGKEPGLYTIADVLG